MSPEPEPHLIDIAHSGWISLNDHLAHIGVNGIVHEDQVAEFAHWFILPYAARHGYPISRSLEEFLASVDYNLDMDEDLTGKLALVPALKAAQESSRGFVGFSQFVWENYNENLVTDECELSDEDMVDIAESLELWRF